MYTLDICCIIILLFLLLFHATFKGEKSRTYRMYIWMNVVSIVHIVLSVITTYTLNYMEQLPRMVNQSMYRLYFGCLILLFYCTYRYIVTLVEVDLGKALRGKKFSVGCLIGFEICLLFLPIYFTGEVGARYSYGLGPRLVYFVAGVFLAITILIFIKYQKQLSAKKRSALFIVLLAVSVTDIFQLLTPTLWIFSFGVVLINLGFFLTVENPDAVLVQRLQQETERADRANEARNVFIANISHEIRTPINAVIGMNEMILREARDKEIIGYAKDVEYSARSLLAMVNDILYITQTETAEDVDALSQEKVEEEKAIENRKRFEAEDAKVLVIDDIELNRKVFKSLVKEMKLQVFEAESGLEAVEMVQIQDFDIIFMDYLMPEMNGVETLHAMEELEGFSEKHTPVVMLTANALAGSREEYLKEGFVEVLNKPIEAEQLADCILSLLEQAGNTPIIILSEEERKETEEETEKRDFPMVDGLDWNYAKLHFPDDSMLWDMVALFYEDMEEEAQALESYFVQINEEENRKMYQIKVHGMKNMAATVGIVPLAGLAKTLEDAAKNADVELIQNLHPIFLKKWKEYKGRLEFFKNEAEPTFFACDYPDEVTHLLLAIRNAARLLDIDRMDEVMKILKRYEFEGEGEEAIRKIRVAVNDFDVDYLQNIDVEEIVKA